MGILEKGNHSGDIVLWGQREYGGNKGNARKMNMGRKEGNMGRKGNVGRKGMWNMGKIGVWEGMECRDMVR